MEITHPEKIITDNAFEILNSINGSSQKVNVDLTLQVMNVGKTNTQNKNIITLALCDFKEYKQGFITIETSTQKAPQIGDIIQIKIVSFGSGNKTKCVLIHSYSILGNYPEIIYNKGAIGSKITQAESVQKTVQKEINPDEGEHFTPPSTIIKKNNNAPSNEKSSDKKGEFNYKNCQLLSYLTTFSKNIHIYVKIEKKGEVKRFVSRRSSDEGKLINLTMVDIEGFEMIATVFGKGVDFVNDTIIEGKTYEIKGGYVKINEKKYSSNKADYKLVFDDQTKFIPQQDNGLFKGLSYSFVTIEEINKVSIGSIVDIIGIAIETSDAYSITTKSGDQMIKKAKFGDSSEYKVEVTFWRKLSETNIIPNRIYILRNVRVGEFNGRTLSTLDTSDIITEPNLPQVEEVETLKKFRENDKKNWKDLPFTSSGMANDINMPTEITFLRDLYNEIPEIESGLKDKGNLYKFKATVCGMNHSERNYYAGCPEKACKKKLSQDSNGWFCQSCNKGFQEPCYYFTINLRVRDSSGEFYIDLFGDLASKLLGIKAEEYKDLWNVKDEVKLREISDKIEFNEYFFIGKGKYYTYQEVSKKRITVFRFESIDKKAHSSVLLKLMKAILLNKV